MFDPDGGGRHGGVADAGRIGCTRPRVRGALIETERRDTAGADISDVPWAANRGRGVRLAATPAAGGNPAPRTGAIRSMLIRLASDAGATPGRQLLDRCLPWRC